MQGGSVPAQNVYQCRVQEEKAAALKSSSQSPSDKDLGAAVSNGNQTGPASSNSLTSFHSQVSSCTSCPAQPGSNKTANYNRHSATHSIGYSIEHISYLPSARPTMPGAKLRTSGAWQCYLVSILRVEGYRSSYRLLDAGRGQDGLGVISDSTFWYRPIFVYTSY